ncbi:protein FAM13A isoform X3 [Rhinatrema bivittatum]|uniref:protein FAM13A isoform X3 n=1 Tax=Rhinatrema bivittatum TaxID=194408 RepID=UPI00112BEAEB|nr:protein FAM13A isoform X3 [Rhinatrema bivittatum]
MGVVGMFDYHRLGQRTVARGGRRGARPRSAQQSKTAARLREDMKRLAAQHGCPAVRRVFGAPLAELREQQGLARDGIPAMVCDVVEYLSAGDGLRQEGLFRVSGSMKVVDQLRLKYESGEEVELARDGDVNSAASLLKLFLRELPDSIITAALHPKFIQLYLDSINESEMEAGLKELIQELPDAHHSLLKYLCRFLARVAEHHKENRMNIFNLATVFGPNFFRVPAGTEGMRELETCNRIVVKLLASHSTLFESELTAEKEEPCEDSPRIITVKEASSERSLPMNLTSETGKEAPKPSPRRKVSCEQLLPVSLTNAVESDVPKPFPRRKISVSKCEASLQPFSVPQPELSAAAPLLRLRLAGRTACLEEMDLADEIFLNSPEPLSSSQEDDRPISPFYLSAHVPASQAAAIPASGDFLERTIRSAVEQHLFDVHGSGQSSEDSESGTSSASSALSARQRRRHLKEQDEARRIRDREVIDKENIPSVFGSLEEGVLNAQEADKLQENCSGYIEERIKPKRQKSSSKLSELHENQDSPLSVEGFGTPRAADHSGPDSMEVLPEESKENEFEGDYLRRPQISSMKIQEHQSNPETKQQKSQDAGDVEKSFVPEVPRLDLSSLCDDKSWEADPVPSLPSWQQDGPDREEASLSPQAGHLIRQLLDGDSDPMLSPRFYAYGQSQQYLDDTEVPPSPPNSHSFMRRRSSSLGSYEDDQEDLSPVQLTRRIQSLKKKIRKFEERFEEERKYRPSHSDKAGNPEVLKWTNELAKFRKQLKESKLKISEEDLAPQVRQRSNTLPKSFGSQLEKEEERKQEAAEKAAKPSVEATLETIQKKLQEKRTETSRPEDIKDMTREEIATEKVSLQKALLYYESVHGRPATKNERQVMKPLYDRYRLVKQILYRASTIPVLGSPSSKRRSPLLQPIIEGETASFFKDKKEEEEEEEGSEDDTSIKADFLVTEKPGFSVRNFLEQLEDDADGFISPMDDKMPSKNAQDVGLSNLHSASMPELLEQLQEMREEKKKIRKKLRDFEDNFFRQNSRNVQKEDRGPMAEEYSEYKHIKAKLRLLEVLISKRDASKVV